ncbi:MAG: hypothetical protein RBS34_05970 [Desulfofustis sp.]|jgi:hypothetical protein|nr:hypothetical protein [Desulfofustis sp.]
MAERKRRQATKIKFEVSRSGIGGIAVVCFCIFLWMFLFGVWTGQSLLKPEPPVVTGFDSGSVPQEAPVIEFDESKKSKP